MGARSWRSRFSSLRKCLLPGTRFTWIQIAAISPSISRFYLDRLSLVMLLVVTGVGFLIQFTPSATCRTTPATTASSAYLNLFMFFMLTLVLADNYLLMFIGWEGVGLASIC